MCAPMLSAVRCASCVTARISSLYVLRPAHTMTPLTGISSNRVARANCSRSGRATERRYCRASGGGTQQGIRCTGLGKTPCSQAATFTFAARTAVGSGVITAGRHAVIKSQLEADPDDARLGELLERRPDADGLPFHADA